MCNAHTCFAWQVLGGLVDKVIPLDDSSIPVIQDTLAILTSKEIKLSSLRRYMYMYMCMYVYTVIYIFYVYVTYTHIPSPLFLVCTILSPLA